MSHELNNFEEIIGFHRKMITRARYWAVISSIAGIGALVIGFFLLGENPLGKSLASVSGVAITGIGLAWPLREMYNVRNRIEAIKLFKKRYVGPPEASDEEKVRIKSKIDEIMNKSI